jgi:hypothetical protein
MPFRHKRVNALLTLWVLKGLSIKDKVNLSFNKNEKNK